MAWLPTGDINTEETVRNMPEGTPLPPGVYTGMVVKSTQKHTNDRTGIYVEVEIDVKHPAEFIGRKIWDRFNIQNASQKASQIGREGIADLGKACGIPVLSDDEQLVGHQVMMEVMVEAAKKYTDKNGNEQEGKAQNKVKKYWAMGTDIEKASKAHKELLKQKAASAPPAAGGVPAATGTAKWGGNAAPAASAAQQQSAAPAPAADTATKPWKRNKQ